MNKYFKYGIYFQNVSMWQLKNFQFKSPYVFEAWLPIQAVFDSLIKARPAYDESSFIVKRFTFTIIYTLFSS